MQLEYEKSNLKSGINFSHPPNPLNFLQKNLLLSARRFARMQQTQKLVKVTERQSGLPIVFPIAG